MVWLSTLYKKAKIRADPWLLSYNKKLITNITKMDFFNKFEDALMVNTE